jgi:predicted nuclease of predicted toxin-antitoxin system
MRLLVDMNLSPRWVAALKEAGVEASHWSTVGASTAPDEEVLGWVAVNGWVLLTHDLDFGTILAASGAGYPKRDSDWIRRPAS